MPVRDGGDVEPADELERRLLKFAGDGIEERTAEQTAVAMVAAARGFHKREDKPFWWAHFDRVNNPVDEWADNTDVFVAEQAEVVADWHQPPKARKPQRHVKLIGELANGELGREMFALYDPPAPEGLADDPDRRAFGSVTVVECDNPEAPTEAVVVERQPKDGDVFDQLPFALTPGGPVNTKPLQESIADTAAMVAAGLPNLPADAVTDILLRRPPRTVSGGPLPRTGNGTNDIADVITKALLDLDSSYLAVHGPPGTGKTFTSARVIARLRERRTGGASAWSRNRTPSSRTCSAASSTQEWIRTGWARRRARTRRGGTSPRRTTPRSSQKATGCVIGGTAWDFANSSRVPRLALDLLVVEEAGQYSLANTIAVAPSARNLMLLGDPQQLPQVSQGTHPEPVNESALGWLVEGHHTLPRAARLLPRLLVPDAPRGMPTGVPALLRRSAALARGRQRRPPPRRA